MNSPDRREVLDLLAKWNSDDLLRSKRAKDTLRSMAHRHGYKPLAELQNFVEFAILQAAEPDSDSDDEAPSKPREFKGGLTFDPHTLAKTMLKEGFKADGMDYPEKAMDYILMAANNKNTIDELPPSGIAFWKAAEFRYRIFVAKKKLQPERL